MCTARQTGCAPGRYRALTAVQAPAPPAGADPGPPSGPPTEGGRIGVGGRFAQESRRPARGLRGAGTSALRGGARRERARRSGACACFTRGAWNAVHHHGRPAWQPFLTFRQRCVCCSSALLVMTVLCKGELPVRGNGRVFFRPVGNPGGRVVGEFVLLAPRQKGIHQSPTFSASRTSQSHLRVGRNPLSANPHPLALLTRPQAEFRGNPTTTSPPCSEVVRTVRRPSPPRC